MTGRATGREDGARPRRRCSPGSGPRAVRATAAGCGSTSGWRPVSARPTGCSRRAIVARRAGPTSSSGSSRRTADPRPRSCSTASRSFRDGASSTAASSSRRWIPTRSWRDTPRRPGRRARHTNAPGSERAKRWEDVDVLLDAGIDVVSTCNIQHLESVADAVATITGAPVNERIPDEVLAAADEVELVDMSPYALRQRMRHGNVYPPDRTRIALDRFFTESNLTALRELSLRFVAGRVDAQLEGIGSVAAHPERERARPRPGRCVAGDAAGASSRRGHCGRPAGAAAGPVVETPADAVRRRSVRRIREYLDDATDLGAEIVSSRRRRRRGGRPVARRDA